MVASLLFSFGFNTPPLEAEEGVRGLPRCLYLSLRCSAKIHRASVLYLTYLLGDHLGSTSIVTDSAGALVVETRYKPCPYRVLREGEVRFTTEDLTLPTRYTFTGQYSYCQVPIFHTNDK
jgi:hypothetical protein